MGMSDRYKMGDVVGGEKLASDLQVRIANAADQARVDAINESAVKLKEFEVQQRFHLKLSNWSVYVPAPIRRNFEGESFLEAFDVATSEAGDPHE